MRTDHEQKDHTGITFSSEKLEEIVAAARKGDNLEVFNNGSLFRTITADSILSAMDHPEQPFGGIIYHDYQGRGYPSGNELRLTS